MTPNQIAAAYRAVHELSGTVFPYKTARGVAALKKRLGEEFDAVTEMRAALINQFGGQDEGETIHFADNTAATGFYDKYKTMMEEDTEIDLPHIDLSKYADSIRISPDAVSALEGLVVFDKE